MMTCRRCTATYFLNFLRRKFLLKKWQHVMIAQCVRNQVHNQFPEFSISDLMQNAVHIIRSFQTIWLAEFYRILILDLKKGAGESVNGLKTAWRSRLKLCTFQNVIV